MSDATLAMADLAAKLAAVAPVRMGRAALETTSAGLPVITIWSTPDRPSDDQGYGRNRQYTRAVTIEMKVAATDTYDAVLDNALSAIRQSLTTELRDGSPLSGYATAIREGTATFFAPGDNGETAAIQVTLEFDYLERFT
jgi:hypothetical protein